MRETLLLALLFAPSSARVLDYDFTATAQKPIYIPEVDYDKSTPSRWYAKKKMVSSEDLQKDIDVKALFKRAEKLSDIADLSIEEYGHPTRVIGSMGKQTSQSMLAHQSRLT